MMHILINNYKVDIVIKKEKKADFGIKKKTEIVLKFFFNLKYPTYVLI